MKNRFYLACFRDNVGSNISFHCIDGKGYSTNVDKAHEYTLAEAQKAWDAAREFDQPISSDHIDSLAVWKVDHQLIPNESQCASALEDYVAFKKGLWLGNDVYFLNKENGSISIDFSQASILTPEEAWELDEQYVVIPHSVADKVKRRTFCKDDYNARVMVQGAGLKIPEHIKQYRRKKVNPKSRFNCPACGKINWQHNSNDFESCSSCGHAGDL
ncbi:hypothetical protein [Acinetobacter colistiniresistens]|uniref:hypothetical protein n=1 Tax=Acinetobacter colistiniresistens TaxID=280145 RepID=UPI001250BFC0|nr:hypothetical protein [Acinetobacter colistiniresistens]